MSSDGLEGQEDVLRVSKGCLGSMCGVCVEGVRRMSGGFVWIVCSVSGECLGGIWMVSGVCQIATFTTL